jgi:hypothetical protein
MNKPENKIIADKLDSLDTLPEGYQPNINSKWALLEESMNEQRAAGSRMNRRWMNVAASFLFFLGTISLWMYMERVITITWVPDIVQPDPVSEVKLNSTGSPTDSFHPSKKPVMHPRKEIKKETEPVIEETVSVPVESSGSAIQIQPIASLPSKATHKKQRYVQIDFDDSTTASDPPTKQNLFAQSFRFKLGLKKFLNHAENYPADGSALKLKQNF